MCIFDVYIDVYICVFDVYICVFNFSNLVNLLDSSPGTALH